MSALQIGITGGIGSGKTTVCRIFEVLGVPVYYADDRAKQLMVKDPDLIQGIREAFGEESYTKDGKLNRAHLANIVFNDKSKLNILNGLVHPAVAKDGLLWHEKNKNVPYTLKEAALLYEAGSYKMMDKIIVVTAPREVRIQRVLKRDKTTREAVEARMDKQMPQEEKEQRADFLIHNDSIELLIPQVMKIHQHLTHLSISNIK